MQKDVFENWQKTAEWTVESCRKLGETNLRLCEKLWKEQIDLTNALVETWGRGAECVSEAKDIKACAAEQAEYTQEWAQQVAESCQSCAEILTDATKTYNQVFEGLMKTANVNVGKPAAGKSKKSA